MQILDEGYVNLISTMGTDWTPVEAARISYDNGRKTLEQDRKLLKYLLRNGHTSPFEMVECTWEVKAPIFVARQWGRHRTANWNEVSARYTELPDEYYMPKKFRVQDKVNKQGSGEPLETDDVGLKFMFDDVCQHAFQTYHKLLEHGVSKEQARMILPVNTYTRWIWKNDLHNTLHFLKLRCDEHAQYEIRQYALAMKSLLYNEFPEIMAAWEDANAGRQVQEYQASGKV